MSDRADRLRELVSDVAAAYFSNTHVSPTEIAGVLEKITSSLGAIGGPPAEPALKGAAVKAGGPPLSSTEIRNSVKPDGIVSFEDGRSYKTLKRHLSSRGMTPAQYRQKWGLPPDYPMVAPDLSAVRSQLARGMRLGGHSEPAQEPVIEPPRKRRDKHVSR